MLSTVPHHRARKARSPATGPAKRTATAAGVQILLGHAHSLAITVVIT